MADPVSTIRNLGPASDQAFARAGISSAEEVRELGPDKAYRKLLETGTPPHFIGYYALVMGLQGRPWNDCQGSEKAALKERFEALKRQTAKAAPPAIEQALNDIGVIPRPRADKD